MAHVFPEGYWVTDYWPTGYWPEGGEPEPEPSFEGVQLLKISDGTTDIDFLNDPAYRIVRWNPAVSRRRDSLLGGRGPYEDVVEEIEITVTGTTAHETLEKLTTLQGLFDQVTRWARGENVSAVLFHYTPTSGSDELKATILGPAERGQPMIELPRNFVNSPVYQVIDPVVIRFTRLGVWLGDGVTSTSSTAANPALMIATSGETYSIASPYTLALNGIPDSEEAVWGGFVLMTASATTTGAAERIVLLNAETLTGTGWTTAADSTNFALNNQVLRYTPTGTTASESGNISVDSSAAAGARRWGVYLSYRNNSTSTSWRLQAKLNDRYFTPELSIPDGTSNPQWQYLGGISLKERLREVRLSAAASNTAGTIDFDTVVLHAQDSMTADRAIAIHSKTGDGSDFASPDDLTIEHRLLTNPEPAVYFPVGANSENHQSYGGDPVLLTHRSVVAVSWLGTGFSTAGNWRVTNSAGTVASPSITLTIAKAYLTPE